MTAEAKFKYALIEMMKEKPLEDINVTALCERCGYHRQTFYYHFQDIYDLLAAILLNEKTPELDQTTEVKGALLSLVDYASNRFAFLKAAYNSSAHDLVEDFFFNKAMTKIYSIISKKNQDGLTKDGYRKIARRYAKMVGDEFGFNFHDKNITPQKFERAMKKFLISSLETVYPALIKLAKEEKKK